MADTPVGADQRLAPVEPARRLLVRPRLLAVLQRRFDRRLTTVVAGPGFGKTSLLAQAVAENRLAPRGVDLWLGCQPGDASVSVLAAGLLAALDAPGPAGDSVETAAVAAAVAAAVGRRSPTPVALLVDDAHLIPPGSPGAVLLAALADRLPATGHLVLAGRPPLPVPTARLAAQGHTLELGEHQLAFDAAELAAFAALRQVPAQLVGATSGWPALAELTASVGQQRAWDFLWEELLARLPARRRRLLAALAVVGGADAALAAALADGPVNLDELLADLPLVAGTPGGWRSLHPLWTPPLARELSEDQANTARRQAAVVLLRRGAVDPAMRLLVQAQAWDTVRTVICKTGAASHPLVAPDVFAAWYSWLPEDLQRGPEGLLLRGLVDKGRDLPAAVQRLERAAEEFRAGEDVVGETAALTHLAHISGWRQDFSRLAAVAQRTAELTPVGSADLVALGALGQVLIADISGEPRRALTLLAAIPASTLSNELAATVEWFRAWALLALGEPEQARPHAEAAVAQAVGTFHSTSVHIQVLTWWLSGRIEEALDELPTLADATTATGRAHNIVFERGTCALLLAYAGRGEAAQDHLAAARAALPGARGGTAAELVYTLAQVAIQVGRGEDDQAHHALVAELAQRPLEQPWVARLHRLFLALSYLLVPETRPHWEAVGLGPRFQTARALARALVAVRETGRLPAELGELPAAGLVRAVLPARWAVELAVAAVAAGRPGAAELLAALGDPARPVVKSLAERGPAPLVRTARALLADLPPPPRHRLDIAVLGPLRLARDGQPVPAAELRRERVRALLLYLVACRTTTREQAAAALWPELDAEAADRNLRVTLTYLHRLLEPDRADGDPPYVVRSAGGQLGLHHDPDWIRLDVASFDQLLDTAQVAERAGVPSQALDVYRQALALYRGEYLADLPDADWAALERDRLRARFVTAAVRTGELLLATGQHTPAERLATRALAAEPYAEPAYRLLMAAALARQDRAGAHRAWQRCQAMLADLGAHPEPATGMLARRILHPTPPPTQPASAGGEQPHRHGNAPRCDVLPERIERAPRHRSPQAGSPATSPSA